MSKTQNMIPFKIGDKVTFLPDERTVGRAWSSLERLRIKPGDTGVVTRIEKDMYVYLDDDRGGFHWECYKKIS